jgi:hypothetical protein
MLALKASESPGQHSLIEGFVPDETALFHTVETFLQFPYMVLEAGSDETLWLFHVAHLVCVKQAVKESSLDIKLFDFPI